MCHTGFVILNIGKTLFYLDFSIFDEHRFVSSQVDMAVPFDTVGHTGFPGESEHILV